MAHVATPWDSSGLNEPQSPAPSHSQPARLFAVLNSPGLSHAWAWLFPLPGKPSLRHPHAEFPHFLLFSAKIIRKNFSEQSILCGFQYPYTPTNSIFQHTDSPACTQGGNLSSGEHNPREVKVFVPFPAFF